jgi:hypothetical protein
MVNNSFVHTHAHAHTHTRKLVYCVIACLACRSAGLSVEATMIQEREKSMAAPTRRRLGEFDNNK